MIIITLLILLFAFLREVIVTVFYVSITTFIIRVLNIIISFLTSRFIRMTRTSRFMRTEIYFVIVVVAIFFVTNCIFIAYVIVMFVFVISNGMFATVRFMVFLFLRGRRFSMVRRYCRRRIVTIGR